MNTTRFLVWDLPTRIFHWLLTGGFIAAAALAFLTDHKSSLFPYHALVGLVLALMVAFRVIWGVIGTRYARFGSFLFGPRALAAYLKGAFTGTGTRHIGHNPGSAYASLAMLLLVVGISVTGIMLPKGHKALKEAHEVMSYALIGFAVAHVLGVIFHTLRHRENITLSMIDGKKDCDPSHAIVSVRPVAAALFVVLVCLWTLGLVRNYAPATKTVTLPAVGTSLRLGDNEKKGKNPGRRERKHDDD